uniref:starch-binding protein n=1 Tax=Prevotella sp. TaxID=59823 RepID=UPI003FF0CE76
MKKRFTLMMMVLCILMSIPLKMMAESVTIHYINDGEWADVYAYVYQKGGGTIGTAWHGTKCIDIKKNDDGKYVATWTLNLGDNLASNACVVFNDGIDNGQQYPAKGNDWIIENGASYNKDGKITSSSEGGGSGTPGGGSTDPTVEWDTEKTNRLKNHVYSQGFYLAGNFFSFQPKENVDHGDLITYDDAVFKFQQQTDQDISSAKGARTVYEVYKVEIPASLTAHAQVMYVDEFGKIKNIFGPGSACGISKTNPKTDESTGWLEANANVCDPITQENNNYWLFASRNETENEYSDGMYNLYIAVDAKTHTVEKWKIVHDSDKRVAYFISDAPDATALPVYDAYDKNVKYFSNRFYASVNFSADRSYYVISNYVHDQQLVSITKDKGYGTIKNNKNYLSTANKLFLQGNGGYEFSTSDQHNEFSPNEKPMPGNDLGTIIVEYKAKQANYQSAEKENHLGIRGQVHFRDGFMIIKSVSMVGDAIPGTLNDDDSWDYTSKAADMIYDDVEQCYTTTIVTTVDDGKKHFRFVGNHTEEINWYEDTDGSEPKKMARTLYTDSEKEGHTADVNDPNKVNYTKKDGAKSEDAYHIIWNRPAGRWTVRFYFYTYNVDGEPVTDYYYTISPCKDLELRDCVNIVYKSEDNKRVIKNVGEYKFLRTWSDEKAWKVSKDIDIYVVDELSADQKNNAVTLHLNLLNSTDKSGNYNVIPANIGVILGTKKEAAAITGGAVFHKRTSLTSLNTVVVPMYEYNANEETSGTSVTSKLQPLTYARVVPTSEIVDGKVTYNYLFGAGKGKSVGIDCENENDFFMGFWISNGKGNFYSNSCYLSIDKETADILGVGTRNDQFNPVTHAKMVPGVIFDFANVGGTTGINEVVNQSTKLNDGKYYTLSGQQVEKPTAGGIYIHNGRKFVVK